MKTIVIAEVGSNWKTLDDLLRAADFAYSVGAIPKAQAWHVDHLCSKERDPEQYETLKRYQIPEEWYPRLLDAGYFFSVFCPDIVDQIEATKSPEYYKISAPDYHNDDLISRARSTKKKVIVSNGQHIFGCKCDLIKLFCISAYPAKSSMLKLMNSVDGISDHTTSVLVPAYAVAQGAKYVEKHFKLKPMDTPDNLHSLTPDEFKNMLSFIRDAEHHYDLCRETIDREYQNRARATRHHIDGLRPSSLWINEAP